MALAATTSALALIPSATVRADPLVSARAQAAAIAAKLAQLNQQQDAADERYNQAQIALGAAEQRQAQARAAEQKARRELEARKAVLTKAAINAYMGGGQVGALQVLAQSNEKDFGVQQSYLRSVVNGEQDAVDGYQQAEANLAQQESVLAQATRADQTDVKATSTIRQQLAQMVQTEQQTLSQAQGRVAQLVAAAQAAAEAAAAARVKAAIEAQAARDAAARAAAQAAAAASASPGGPDRSPVSGDGGGGVGGGGVGDGPGGVSGSPPPSGSGAGTAVQWAQNQIGKPYVYGAAGPDSFDCSGLTMYVWAHAGAQLTHSAADQWSETTRITYAELQPGDLIFYYQPIDHVAIYVGNDTMIEAAHTGTNVRYASIWRSGLDGFGRVSG